MNRFVLMISKSISVIGAMTWKEYMIWISGACCIISKRCVILDVIKSSSNQRARIQGGIRGDHHPSTFRSHAVL